MTDELAFDPERESLRQALYDLEVHEQEVARRRRQQGLNYFIPNPPQSKALRSPARTVAYVGGNRSGKSSCGAYWLACHLTHNYPKCDCHGEWFSMAYRFNRPLKAVIVATEFPIIERTIEPKLMSQLPKDWIADNGIKRTPQGYLRRVLGKDGGLIDVLTNEMDQMAFESADWDLAWIDEPMSRGKYFAVNRGLLDRGGPKFLSFTPLIEPWMKEEIVDRADGKHIDVIQADTYENTADIHGNAILSREHIEEFERDMPEDLRQTRIHGRFFHLRGIVYMEYSSPIHERDWAYQYPDPVICALDPHDRQPHHVIWAWLNRLDHIHVDRELVMNGTVQELKKAILWTEQQAGYRIRMRLIDPNFGRRPLISTGRTLVEDLARPPFPVRFFEANDDKTTGILKVKEYLHYNSKLPLGLTNMPRLYFHQTRVPKTIHSIRNYQYEEWKGQSKDEKDPKEKDKQKDTHGADVIRYLSMMNPTFDSPFALSEKTQLEEAPY